MLVRRRLRQIVLLFSSVAVVVPVVYFLVKQGLDRAEKITSIAFGLLGAVGLVVNWRTARPGMKPGATSPTESVPLGCLLHLRDDGRPPLVGQVDPLDLGVKPAIDTTDRHDQDLPPYVPRTGDDDLEWAIAEGGIVLLHGKAAAGKSRSAFEAIHRLRPHHQLLTPAYAGALKDVVEAGYPIRDAVVWLDDLERFLTPGGIDQALLQRLCPSGRADVVVVATIRDEELSRLDHATRHPRRSRPRTHHGRAGRGRGETGGPDPRPTPCPGRSAPHRLRAHRRRGHRRRPDRGCANRRGRVRRIPRRRPGHDAPLVGRRRPLVRGRTRPHQRRGGLPPRRLHHSRLPRHSRQALPPLPVPRLETPRRSTHHHSRTPMGMRTGPRRQLLPPAPRQRHLHRLRLPPRPHHHRPRPPRSHPSPRPCLEHPAPHRHHPPSRHHRHSCLFHPNG